MRDFVLADFQGFGIIIFLVVSFISWLLNLKNQAPGNKQPRPRRAPQQRPQRPAEGKLQGELEAFLKEVQAGQGKPQQPRPEPARRPAQRPTAASVPRKPVSETAVETRQTARQQRPPQPKPQRQQTLPQLKRSRVTTPEPPPAPHGAQLGAGLRSHVQEYMANQIDESVKHHIDGIKNDLAVAAVVSSRTQSRLGREIIAALRDPASIRNAMILNEVLQRPKALR